MRGFPYLVCLAVSLVPLSAQTTAGAIVGTVTDPSGAILQGAAITVINIETSIAVRTKTDQQGNYVVTPLAIGRYSVTV